MAGKTGLSAQLGFGQQVDQTTRIAPTRFYEFLSESLTLDSQRVSSSGLRAGKRVEQYWRENRKGVAGSVTLEHPVVGSGILWKNILGALSGTATPVGATTARDHTLILGDLDGDFLTVQKSLPRVSGSAPAPRDFVGCKVVSASLTQNVDGFLQLEVTLDGYDMQTGNTLATASYPADLAQFFYEDCTITIDGTDYAADDFSLAVDNGLKTDRYKLRGDTRKLEQIEETAVNGRNISGSMASDFDGGSIADLYPDGTEFPVVVTWASPYEIEAGFNYELEITLPRCRADEGVATVGGPDVVTQPLGFKVLKPGYLEPISVRVRDSLTAP